MKYFVFICQGLTDSPLEDLGGRTPLEAAKTPVMDGLAQNGRMRIASFVPASLAPTPDVAVLSILGYDPLALYTGLAPLEIPAFGFNQDDREVIFRADLVSLLDEALMDPRAGNISEREAGILMHDVHTKFSSDKFQFCRGKGFKNYLAFRDESLVEDLDELECAPPALCLGQKTSKCLPKGKGSTTIIRLMNDVGVFLDNHEINRVRIDLGENPANRLWFWGQGKKPKLQSFEKQYGLKGAFYGEADFFRGIAKATGLTPIKKIEALPASADVVCFYFGAGDETRQTPDLKSKIKRIEEFDVFVGSVLKEHAKDAYRVWISGDLTESLTEKSDNRNPTLVLTSGEGISAEKNTAFNEKACAQNAAAEKSHELLPAFLKK